MVRLAKTVLLIVAVAGVLLGAYYLTETPYTGVAFSFFGGSLGAFAFAALLQAVGEGGAASEE